jgi:hypothetical protein
MRLTKHLAPLGIKLLEPLIHLLDFTLYLAHLQLGLHTRLARGKNGYLTLHEHILTVLLIGADAKGAREIQIQKLVVPGSPTAHTMGIQSPFSQILLQADGAGSVVAIRTAYRLSQLDSIFIATHWTVSTVSHCSSGTFPFKQAKNHFLWHRA